MENQDESAALQTSQEREVPLDTRLLSDAVIELNISRKNVGIYPPGHVQITRSIERAFEILQRLFVVRSEMTLGVAKDTLLVGQDYLDPKNPVYRDFALSLNQHGIAAVTFAMGLTMDELTRFHRILTTKAEDIRAAGGIDRAMTDAELRHIRIQSIDYGSFHVTEEQEIIQVQKKTREKPGVAIWQDFVAKLVEGTLAVSGGGVSLKDSEQIDPADLARLLNERRLDASAAIESYDHVISDYVRGVAEKRQLTHEQSETLSKLNALIRDLHPDLRRQFLSNAYRRVAEKSSSLKPEELLGGMPDDIVIDMIRQASEEGKEISPTLTGLVQKLSGIGEKGRAEAVMEKSGTSHDLQIPEISAEHMQRLFERESYEKYVPADYDASLKQISEGKAGITPGIEGFPVEDHGRTLEDDLLDFQIGRALLAFIEEDIEDDDYREFCGKLAAIVPGLLKTGNFALLLDIHETLKRHEVEKKTESVRSTAEESRKIFHKKNFIDESVRAFGIWARTKGREAAGLLLALGPETLPGLLDLYSEDKSPGGRKILFDLLCNFGQSAVNEAYKRLKDTRAYYVRNLVMLIRWAGGKTSVPHIKPLLQHHDEKVRLEVIAALLRFKDPDATGLLREKLRSKDPDVAAQAAFLAGQYRVTEVAEDVASMLKKVILFETDYRDNEEIIKALGEIGDPRVIPDLERLAKATLSLYPSSLNRMKIALFESLGRYPGENVSGLLTIGEKSSDERIKRACRKIRERK